MTSAIPGPSDQALYQVECAILALLVTTWSLAIILRWLRTSRPGFDLAFPIGVAVVLRVAGIGVLAGVSSLTAVRGPDDAGFLAQATTLADQAPWNGAWIETLAGNLHLTVVAGQIAVLGTPGDFSLRVIQILIAVSGIALLSAAAFDLGGPRAATVAAWVLAFEPASIFFSGLLHKEALMLLAVGLVALGGARMWTQRDARAAVMIGAGGAIALATRPYAGFFLLGAGALITFHAALLKAGPSQRRALPLAAALALGGLVAAVVLAASSSAILNRIQQAQDTNTADRSNLRLEPVDFSTPGAVVVNLPKRVQDLMLRPYPWQNANTSQRFGAAGTAAAWAILAAVLVLLVVRFRQTVWRGPPLAYIALFLVIAFALAAGNAGTGFRYRTHVVAVLAGLGAVLAGGPAQGRNPAQVRDGSDIPSRERMRPVASQ